MHSWLSSCPSSHQPTPCLFFVLVARVGHGVMSLLVSHRTFRTYPAAAPRISALHPTARCMQHSGCIACICRVFHLVLITSSLSFYFLSHAREGQLSGEYRYIQCLSFFLSSFFLQCCADVAWVHSDDVCQFTFCSRERVLKRHKVIKVEMEIRRYKTEKRYDFFLSIFLLSMDKPLKQAETWPRHCYYWHTSALA